MTMFKRLETVKIKLGFQAEICEGIENDLMLWNVKLEKS